MFNGDRIPYLVADVTGINLEEITVEQMLGNKIFVNGGLKNEKVNAQATAIWFLAPNIEGKLVKINGIEEAGHIKDVIKVNTEAVAGAQLHVLNSSRDRIGWIRCFGNDSLSAIETARLAASKVEFLLFIKNDANIETI